jgi:hypothetical protein
LRPSELVEIRSNLLGVAAEIDRLPDEDALQAQIRGRGTDLVGLPVGKSRDAMSRGKPEALIDLRIDP